MIVILGPWEIDTRDLPIFILRHQKRLVFLLQLALFRLVGLSKRKIIEPSLTAFTGFPFALVFTCTFSECVNCQVKRKSLTAKGIRSWQEQIYSRQSKSTQNEVFLSWKSFCSRSFATLHSRASVSLTVFSIDTRFASYC